MRRVEAQPDTLREHMIGTYNSLRLGIAIIAGALPVVLLLGGWMLDHESLRASMSAYYYSPTMRDVFVGSLAAIGVFLLLYKGFSSREDRALNVAGVAAIAVALFPTRWKCDEVDWATTFDRAQRIAAGADVSHEPWRASFNGALACLSGPDRFGAPWTSNVHGFSALLLFGCLVYVCFRTASDTLTNIDARRIDRYRRIYQSLGTLMIVLPLTAAGIAYGIEPDPTRWSWLFAAEAGAVEAFAAYWYVKSRELRETEAERLALEGRLAANPAVGAGKPGRLREVAPRSRIADPLTE